MNSSKFSTPEIIFVTGIYLFLDAIGVILLLFGLDDFFILDALRFPLSKIYLKLKGVNGTADTVANLLEMVPYLGALPISTLGWITTVVLTKRAESAGLKNEEPTEETQPLSI